MECVFLFCVYTGRVYDGLYAFKERKVQMTKGNIAGGEAFTDADVVSFLYFFLNDGDEARFMSHSV